MTLVLEYVQQPNNVGVVDLFKYFDLLRKRLPVLFCHFLFREHFYGEPLASLSILGLLHRSEGATSDRTLNLVSLCLEELIQLLKV